MLLRMVPSVTLFLLRRSRVGKVGQGRPEGPGTQAQRGLDRSRVIGLVLAKARQHPRARRAGAGRPVPPGPATLVAPCRRAVRLCYRRNRTP